MNMKKMYLLMCSAFVCLSSYSQISINHEHLPDAGDSLVTISAELVGNVDYAATGENMTWDFQDNIIANSQNPTLQCASLNNLSFFNLIFFQNPFDQDYFSDYGIGVDAFDVPNFGITVEDAYQIYKNSGGVYAVTGQVATINSIPVSAKFEDRDVIYDLPLTFGMSGNSDSELLFDVPTVLTYKTHQTRSYECDGWGTLMLCDQSFDVLRVRSVQNGVDSITASFFPVPFGIERPETVTYEWLSTSHKVPVLSVSIADFQTTVNVAPVCNVLGMDKEVLLGKSLKVYPTPCNDLLYVEGLTESSMYSLFNSAGQFVMRENIYPGIPLDLSSLDAGLYQLLVESPNGIIPVKILMN